MEIDVSEEKEVALWSFLNSADSPCQEKERRRNYSNEELIALSLFNFFKKKK